MLKIYILFLWTFLQGFLHEGKAPFNFHSDNLPGTGAVFLFLQVEMDSEEILPGSKSQMVAIQIVFFHLLQLVQPQIKARGKFMEEGVVPGSTAVLRVEEVGDLLEHQLVENQ